MVTFLPFFSVTSYACKVNTKILQLLRVLEFDDNIFVIIQVNSSKLPFFKNFSLPTCNDMTKTIVFTLQE